MNLLVAIGECGVNVDETLRRFAGNGALLERFLKKFPQDETYLDLKKAVEELDYDGIERSAHTLKGTSANLGFQRLSDCCADLVNALRSGQKENSSDLFQIISIEYDKVMDCIKKID